MPKTVKTSEVIKYLCQVVRIYGDLPVYLQEDTEGNGYGTVKIGQSFWIDGDEKKKKFNALVIQPFEEHIDYEDLFKEKQRCRKYCKQNSSVIGCSDKQLIHCNLIFNTDFKIIK